MKKFKIIGYTINGYPYSKNAFFEALREDLKKDYNDTHVDICSFENYHKGSLQYLSSGIVVQPKKNLYEYVYDDYNTNVLSLKYDDNVNYIRIAHVITESLRDIAKDSADNFATTYLDLYLKETINLNMIDPKILSNEIMRMKNVLYCEVVTSERVDVTFKNI